MGLRWYEQLTPRFLFLHDVWALFRRHIGEKITSTKSMAWHFTTKSGGMALVPFDVIRYRARFLDIMTVESHDPLARVVYLCAADKSPRLTRRPSQEQKGL
jgi:hypothetical protein